jgi:transcriptional regulator with XRE-family HTH domain
MRLEKNLTQAQLAEKAGVSKRTVERLERGDVAPQLSGFIRVCRALELVERFELLVPEPVMSPMMQLRLGGKRRRRASARAVAQNPLPAAVSAEVVNEAATVAAAPVAWTWGEDQ